MRQPIYNYIDKIFEYFVIDNKQLLTELAYDCIINVINVKKPIVGETVINHSKFFFFAELLLQKPFNIMYIGKSGSREGDFYTFFNKEMDKAYIYFEANKP